MSDKVLQINKPSKRLLDLVKLLDKVKDENKKNLVAKKDIYFSNK
jgi:hypothetical protein